MKSLPLTNFGYIWPQTNRLKHCIMRSYVMRIMLVKCQLFGLSSCSGSTDFRSYKELRKKWKIATLITLLPTETAHTNSKDIQIYLDTTGHVGNFWADRILEEGVTGRL